MTDSKVFFNYATVSPLSEAAYVAGKTFLEEFYQTGPPEVLYKYDPYAEALAAEAAQLLNCLPSEITTIKNTTEGINIAAESLPLEAGDEILVQSNEYPGNLLPWVKKRLDGLTVTVVEADTNQASFAALLEAIGPQTKAISISSGQYYDGYMANLVNLSQICRDKGIFLVIDAVQTVGIRELDLKKITADFLVCGGQKFLQAGVGIGFMYVNQDCLPKLKTTRVGIRSMQNFDNSGFRLKNTADRFQDGTQNLLGIVALQAALKAINQIGIETIATNNRRLLEDLKGVLKEYDLPFIDHGANQSNIIALVVNDPVGLSDYLKSRSVYIKVIKDVARVSFAHSLRIEDAQTLAKFTREWLDRSHHA